MPLKQDRTSYNVSSNLKTSMQAKGFSTDLILGATYYDGSSAEIHATVLELPGGLFRTIANTPTFTDIVMPSDPLFVRMWVE